MAKKKKRTKRSSDKDALFRNMIFGTLFSVINLIILCVVYYSLFKHPEYRNYLDEGMTLLKYNLTGKQVTLLTYGVAIITPVLFLLRILFLGIWHLITGKNDFIPVMLNIAINVTAFLLIVLISIVLFFLYNVILGYII